MPLALHMYVLWENKNGDQLRSIICSLITTGLYMKSPFGIESKFEEAWSIYIYDDHKGLLICLWFADLACICMYVPLSLSQWKYLWRQILPRRRRDRSIHIKQFTHNSTKESSKIDIGIFLFYPIYFSAISSFTLAI